MRQESENDDRLLRQSLTLLGEDAAAVDPIAIDRVRKLAGDELLQDTDDDSEQVVTVRDQPGGGRRSMITKAVLGISALAAAVLMLLQAPTSDDDKTLGSILDETLQAETLKLAVDRDGTPAEVLVSKASLVRWQDSPTTYRIADGKQLWTIDERAGQAEASDSPWHHDSDQVDLLSLLGLNSEQSKKLRANASSESETIGGKKRYVFTSTAGKAVVHAYFDVASDQLSELRCWPGGFDPQVPPQKLFIVARDIRVDESQFVVAKHLSADGRIAKIIDTQGVVTLRPMLNKRWTPVGTQMLLKAGDWLRTDARGANASTLVTTSQFKVTVGPASLVELRSATELRLHRGELKVVGSKAASADLKLLGPKTAELSVAKGKSSHVRVDREGQLTKVDKKPAWLASLEGASTVDPVGSLLTNIDGRETKLTVGFHKVKVEIRDQIARTTIEESFVNHTGQRLEGIFHFPLPQDASISGFGMWIGGELVEADVVEKQRAREIYETILREKRDPGLLEWTGGNIFKARVFPIEPSSEKRIKIVYTQVLPLRANQYRYSYGLRSEMLQTTPVRELSLDVQIHSALPLRSVDCPTHAVRTQQTEHAAKLEFEAQEYTPTRDFEVVCEVNSSGQDVVVVPHRRGDDGYLMVQLTPPGAAGNWQRELVADGQPLEVLFVCDTSASMDSQQRKLQHQFVSTMLAALGQDDRFDIAVCDVDCGWLHDEMIPPTEQNVGEALNWLGDRLSLGWTDLDRMMESVVQRIGDQTHVIYVGDAMVTARDADPQTFVNRLARLTSEKRSGTLHAVSVGSTFESVVLRALASVGGGSVRQIDGEQTPTRVAMELLNEISQPGLRDLKVEFKGLKVAAVYPEQLPNLAAGTQQILIARYLPQGKDQHGEIVVTGKRGDQTVRFSAPISLVDAEAGNSFIPRLWARSHLDHLLSQGSSQLISDQIIGLSEQFHIITPYTSLLVLESDADRERFGVKRRFEMRDGERFFAEGRSNADFELLQQQMKRAGDWRLALRRRILSQLTELGRDTQVFAPLQHNWNHPLPMSGPAGTTTYSFSGVAGFGGGFGGGGFGGGGVGGGGRVIDDISYFVTGGMVMNAEKSLSSVSGPFSNQPGPFSDQDAIDVDWESDASPKPFPSTEDRLGSYQSFAWQGNDRADLSSREPGFTGGYRFAREQKSRRSNRSLMLGEKMNLQIGGQLSQWSVHDPYSSAAQYIAWAQQLFPALSATTTPTEPKQPGGSDDALKILRSLWQNVQLEPGSGLEVARTTKNFDFVWDRLTAQSRTVQLSAGDRWLEFTAAIGSDTQVSWCNDQERGIFSRAFQTGRTRAAGKHDLTSLMLGLRPLASVKELAGYADYQAESADPGDGTVTVTLIHRTNKQIRIRITIETERKVVTLIEQWNQWVDQASPPTSSTKYSDYVKVANVWWPQQIEVLNEQGQRHSATTQQITLHPAKRFDKRFDDESPNRKTGLLLTQPMPSIRQSHIATRDGTADARHRLTLILDASLVQDWDAALKHLEALEQLETAKPCLPWIRAAVFTAARKNDQVLSLFQSLADTIVNGKLDEDLYLTEYLLGQTQNIGDNNESLRMIERVRDVFLRLPPTVQGEWRWMNHRAGALRRLARPETLDLQRKLATDAPWDFSAQVVYAQDLIAAGEFDDALAWMQTQLDDYPGQNQAALYQIRQPLGQMLRDAGRAEDLVRFLKTWIDAEPTSHTAHDQYLASMIVANRTEDADAMALSWIAASKVDRKLQPHERVRLTAALNYALGQRYQLYLNWMVPKWRQPLADMAIYCLDSEHHHEFAEQIMTRSQFTDSDESDALHTEVAKRLLATAGSLQTDLLATFVRWLVNRDELTTQQWKEIADTITKRWEAEDQRNDRMKFGLAISSIYRVHFPDEDYLPFLRQRINRAERDQQPQDVANFRRDLFNALLAQPWQPAHEDEAAALVRSLGIDDDQTSPLGQQLQSLFELVDRMLEARQLAATQKLAETEHPEQLTRSEYAAKRSDFLTAARQGVAATLAKHEDGADELSQWFRLERMHLDIKLSRNINQVAGECWELLGDRPTEIESPDQAEQARPAGEIAQEFSRSLRRERAFAIVNYLAVRRAAPKKLTNRVRQYVLAGTELKSEAGSWWRDRHYDLLIALDQPDELQSQLRDWIREDPFPVTWQRALARLEAERGNMDEAIALIESVQRLTRLTSEDYAALANWYLLSDQRQKYERAKVAVYEALPEHIISNWLQQRQQRWWDTNVPLPTELDEDVLYAFRALFAKSNGPENYVYNLKRFYEACRDFRLLQMLPDAVTGRTAQQIYPMLQRMSEQLMPVILKEATTDEISKNIDRLREQVDSPLDSRALDLLETMIERQAAKVLDQPGPHIAKAVAAMKRAFKHEWADGEVRQMAQFLGSLDTLARQDLRALRLRQLRQLREMTEPGTEDRFFVSWQLAHTIAWSNGDHDNGITEMEIAMADYRNLHPQGFPPGSNSAIFDYVRMLGYRGRFAEAEKFLNREIDQPLNETQRLAYVVQRNHTYIHALRDRGQVSLGSGDQLYENLQTHLLDQADAGGSDNARKASVDALLKFYRTASEKNYASAKDDLWTFAAKRLPAVLTRQTGNYEQLVSSTSDLIVQLLSQLKALEFMIDRLEVYPERFNYTWNNPWQQFGYKLAQWRAENHGKLGDLEPRLLAIVSNELRRDLRTRNRRSRYIYGNNGSRFWREKADVFAGVAEEVYREHPNSPRSVSYVANYLTGGLGRYPRAIEMMLSLHKQKRLKWPQLNELVAYLHHEQRYAETIPILEPLVESRPDDIRHRTDLLTSYHHTGRDNDWKSLLDDTDAHFRQAGRWIESNVAALANCCLENDYFAEAAAYFGEVIPMFKRSPQRRYNDYYTLSNYYAEQADAFTGLGETAKAVDAASAAIVTYGRNQNDRRGRASTLRQVLAAAKDLDAFVAQHDRQSNASGQDSPLLRKQLGFVYEQRGQHDKAIEQLRAAISLQPTDVETHQKLIEILDKQQDTSAAIRQTMALLDIDRHNLEHYKKLAARLKDDRAMSERAITTIIEAAPLEAEHHQAVAEIRQQQDRWSDAIDQWRQVAKLRRLEPNGLIKLAEAQIHEQQTDQARETIEQLSSTTWPARFSDVQSQIERLTRSLSKL